MYAELPDRRGREDTAEATPPDPRWRRVFIALLVATGAWSLGPMLIILAKARGDFWLGSDYLGAVDHLYYLAAIREAAQHLLISDRFDIPGNPAIYLHPLFALSGGLVRTGVDVRLALAVWKPVAVLVLGGGVALYCQTRLQGIGNRVAAFALGLFLFAPQVVVLSALNVGDATLRGTAGFFDVEWFPASLLWSYYPAAIALGLLAVGFVSLERTLDCSRSARSRRTSAVLTGCAGLLVSWLHPWQGMTFLLASGGLWAWEGFPRRYLRLWPVAVATTVPLLYYMSLRELSPEWARVSGALPLPRFPPGMFVAFAPLAVAAIPGFPGRNLRTGDRLLRLWPIAGLATYALPIGYIYHSFLGLSIPLAVLAVQGWSRLGLSRAAGGVAVAAIVVAGLIPEAQHYQESLHARSQLYLTADEASALKFLDGNAQPGGVFAPSYLGQAVPAYTGRNTWIGHPTLTPDYYVRQPEVDSFFAGKRTPEEGRTLVLGSGATFVLAGCAGSGAAERGLQGLIVSTRRFGCVSVFQVAPQH